MDDFGTWMCENELAFALLGNGTTSFHLHVETNSFQSSCSFFCSEEWSCRLWLTYLYASFFFLFWCSSWLSFRRASQGHLVIACWGSCYIRFALFVMLL